MVLKAAAFTAYKIIYNHRINAAAYFAEDKDLDMKTIPLKPERQKELEEFARKRGKTPADALDEALAEYLEWERQDFEETVRGVQQGYDDAKSGRTRPATEFLSDMQNKHGFSR